jgi:hypothetical protein
MKILIYGSGKTGTTALTYSIKNSLQPEDYKIVFEPSSLANIDYSETNLIVKSLQVQKWRKNIKYLDYFEKKIILVRHPFDIIISSLLYSPFNGNGFSNDHNTNQYINLLKRKVEQPNSVTLQKIINLHQEITKKNLLDFTIKDYQKILEIVKQNKFDFYQLKYEDFVDGNLAQLSEYLGAEIENEVEVAQKFKRVARSKKHSDWKNWFLENDVKTISKLFIDVLDIFEYDYNLNQEEKIIAPETSYLYVINVINEYRRGHSLPEYQDGVINIGEEGDYIDQAIHFLRINDLENMEKNIVQAFKINPNLQNAYATLEKKKKKKVPKNTQNLNTDTFEIKITEINNETLKKSLEASNLDRTKSNQLLIKDRTGIEPLIIKGWILPKEKDVSVKIIAKTSESEKETSLSIKRPDVVEKVLKQSPLDSSFLYCGFRLEIEEIELSEKIELFICIDGVKHHWKTIEIIPLPSTIISPSIKQLNELQNKTKLKALVHIGFHKTGSSSIQQSLVKSKALLDKNGFLYPSLKEVKNQHWPLAAQFFKKPEDYHLIRDRGFANKTELNQWFEKINLDLDKQISSFNGHTCILSAEDFSIILLDHKLTEFQSFLAQRFDSTKIVIYVRPAEKLYDSRIQELAKGGNISLKKLLLPNNFQGRIKKKTESYVKEFGQENISVIKFSPESLCEGDVVKDFQQRFLVTENQEAMELKSTKANESITAAGVVFLFLFSQKIPRHINNRLNKKWQAVRQVILKIPPSETLPKLKIPTQWEEVIKQNHQEEYLWLENTFFDGIRGIFSSPVTISQEPQEVTREEFEAWLMSYLTPEALAEIKEYLREANVLTPDQLSELFTFIEFESSRRRIS